MLLFISLKTKDGRRPLWTGLSIGHVEIAKLLVDDILVTCIRKHIVVYLIENLGWTRNFVGSVFKRSRN